MKLKHFLISTLLLVQQAGLPLALGAQATKTSSAVVAPNEVGEKEAFTFGVVEGEVVSGNTVDGEVVQVATVDGVVVQKPKTDKYGRVFLAAGLAAGTYLVTRSNGSKCAGQIIVKPLREMAGGALLKIGETAKACNIQQGLAIKGQGFNPDAAKLSATIGKKQVPILAATADEIKTGPLPSSVCGSETVKVTNTETGQSDRAEGITFYSLRAKLGRQKLAGGEQTSLEFTFSPDDRVATVNVRILSGPVSFQRGAKEQTIKIEHGKASVLLVADPGGLGAFRVAYDLEKIGD
jgi:hypothetical protein